MSEGMGLMWACPLCSWRNYIPETLMNAVKEVEDRNIIKKKQGLKKNLTVLKNYVGSLLDAVREEMILAIESAFAHSLCDKMLQR